MKRIICLTMALVMTFACVSAFAAQYDGLPEKMMLQMELSGLKGRPFPARLLLLKMSRPVPGSSHLPSSLAFLSIIHIHIRKTCRLYTSGKGVTSSRGVASLR